MAQPHRDRQWDGGLSCPSPLRCPVLPAGIPAAEKPSLSPHPPLEVSRPLPPPRHVQFHVSPIWPVTSEVLVYVCATVCAHMCASLCIPVSGCTASVHTRCISVCVCVHYMPVYMCAYASGLVHVCLYLCAHVCVLVCLWAHVPAHVCVWVRCSPTVESLPGGHPCQAAQSPHPQGSLFLARFPVAPGRRLDAPLWHSRPQPGLKVPTHITAGCPAPQILFSPHQRDPSSPSHAVPCPSDSVFMGCQASLLKDAFSLIPTLPLKAAANCLSPFCSWGHRGSERQTDWPKASSS